MSLKEIVNVQITRDTQTVSQAGFGTLMILDTHKRFNDRIRFYTNIDEVAVDFPSSSLAFIASQDVFNQSPRPNRLAIGRRSADDVTFEVISAMENQNYTVIINNIESTVLAISNTEESTVELDADLVSLNEIDITFNGVSLPTITFTTDHSTTMELIRAELESQPEVLTAVIPDLAERTIILTAMPDQDAIIDSFVITNGASQPNVTIITDPTPVDEFLIAELLKDEINLQVPDVIATTPTIPDGTVSVTANPAGTDYTINFDQDFTLTTRAIVTVTQVIPSREYTLRIAGIPFRFTAPSDVQNNEEIAKGLTDVINDANETFSALDNQDGTFTIGSVDPVSIVGSNLLNVSIAFLVEDITPSQSIADDLDAINGENSDWYAVAYTDREQSDVIEIANWVEPRIKIFGTASSDPDILSLPASSDNSTIAGILNQGGYTRTFVMYHQDAEIDFPECAWFGRVLPTDPGSVTWKFKTLNSISFSDLTTTQSGNVRDKNANTYEFIGGVSITREGTMAVGEFIDVIRGIDWLQARIQENVYALLVNSPKVPYTNRGITAVEGEIRRSLSEAVTNEFIAEDPAFTVTTPDVSNVSPADKANRVLRNVTFQATLAGAIHFVEINGVVSV